MNAGTILRGHHLIVADEDEEPFRANVTLIAYEGTKPSLPNEDVGDRLLLCPRCFQVANEASQDAGYKNPEAVLALDDAQINAPGPANAIERRRAFDGEMYTFEEFAEWYGEYASTAWENA